MLHPPLLHGQVGAQELQLLNMVYLALHRAQEQRLLQPRILTH